MTKCSRINLLSGDMTELDHWFMETSPSWTSSVTGVDCISEIQMFQDGLALIVYIYGASAREQQMGKRKGTQPKRSCMCVCVSGFVTDTLIIDHEQTRINVEMFEYRVRQRSEQDQQRQTLLFSMRSY
ncbi:hypothetical protein JOB18_002082 [Solea senegalensis]|uniref:Uncharacterized protein n=1 Tax=Solea senegalensis TaxID=28829 RepID=A0AAV6PN52_SOLSE|nr:hypothetical protein JOB18_002082 [Solea senegalensis]